MLLLTSDFKKCKTGQVNHVGICCQENSDNDDDEEEDGLPHLPGHHNIIY